MPRPDDSAAIEAQAELHHQYFLGLQLMVASQEGAGVIGDWMFRLFRRQHEDKFLASFAKLGLDGLPHAVACARYHVVSNNIGGVGVEYMEESQDKAWVRFRYPRWMYAGPAICGIPVEASRGFLRGWYAQNGVSLGNPRLGFVCVSEDMTGQFGLCGYFREYDHALSPDQRLRFAPDERPPQFDPARQPEPPARDWTAERLAKANRNYAMDYIRNGLATLAEVLGRDRARELGCRAARLIGLQTYARMAHLVGVEEGGIDASSAFLRRMFAGMGDEVSVMSSSPRQIVLQQTGLRIVRGLGDPVRADLLACWTDLWRGAINAQRAFITVDTDTADNHLTWTLSPSRAG